MKKVGVCGSGLMGCGIAQVSAAAGYTVALWDVKKEYAQANAEKMAARMDERITKGKMTAEEKADLMSRITLTENLADLADCDIIVEAVPEKKEIKDDVFGKLDKLCGEKTIFTSNTSGIPIGSMAVMTKRKDRFMGLHFFYPVPVMKLVEVVRPLTASDETCQVVKAFVESIGKTGVVVKDCPGFLINRMVHALRNEAIDCLAEGVVASPDDLDTAVRLALNYKMGPFEQNDMTGIETGGAVAATLYESYKDPKWRPRMLTKQLIQMGDYGKKTGKGWYDYTSGEKKPRADIKFF